MEEASSFGQQIQQDPDLTFGVRTVEADSAFDVLYKWILNHLVNHMDDSVGAAVPNFLILVVLRNKDEVGVRIFEDLLVRLGSEERLEVLIVQLLPGLVGLLVDEGP